MNATTLTRARRWLLLALLPGLATACATSQAARRPHGFWHHNRLDRQGEMQGRWITYYDSAQTRPQLKARYRHGQSVGRWRHYAAVGYCERREHYHHGLIDISDYHPNGQLWYRGQARIAHEPDGWHYYWFGDWTVYTPAGTLQKVEAYEQGHRVASWSPTAGTLVP